MAKQVPILFLVALFVLSYAAESRADSISYFRPFSFIYSQPDLPEGSGAAEVVVPTHDAGSSGELPLTSIRIEVIGTTVVDPFISDEISQLWCPLPADPDRLYQDSLTICSPTYESWVRSMLIGYTELQLPPVYESAESSSVGNETLDQVEIPAAMRSSCHLEGSYVMVHETSDPKILAAFTKGAEGIPAFAILRLSGSLLIEATTSGMTNIMFGRRSNLGFVHITYNF